MQIVNHPKGDGLLQEAGGTAELSKMVVVGLRGQSLMAEVPHQELQLQFGKGSGPPCPLRWTGRQKYKNILCLYYSIRSLVMTSLESLLNTYHVLSTMLGAGDLIQSTRALT